MTPKKFVSAWLAGLVVTFSLSGLWHEVLLRDFYRAVMTPVARPEVNMAAVAIGMAILTFLMAWMYPTGYKGGPPAVEGVRFGALIGLLWILPWSVIMTGIWDLGLHAVLVDSAWHVVEEGLGGLAIGLVYGRSAARG